MNKRRISLVIFGVLFSTIGAFSHKHQTTKVEAAMVTSDTMRLWIQPNTWEQDNTVAVISFITLKNNKQASEIKVDDKRTNYDVIATYTKSGSYNNSQEDNKTYYYYDVPTSLVQTKYFIVERFNSGTSFNSASNIKNTSLVQTYVTGDSARIYYMGSKTDGSISRGGISKVSAGLVAKIFESYLTCLPSIKNGFLNIKTLESSFIVKDGVWRVVGTMADVNLTDYAYATDYEIDTASAQVNLYSKYQEMLCQKALYDANPINTAARTRATPSSDNISLIPFISLSAFTVLGSIYMISKRKTQLM